jgi:hypothetical protein
MYNFESKELHRTFDTVLFLGGVSKEPITDESVKKAKTAPEEKPYVRKASKEIRKDIKVTPVGGSITIAELMAGKDKYQGKTVLVRGQVTKYNPSIMDKNWIHLQDGTEQGGKFDLVVTSPDEVKVGDVVTLEGKISINKDFGYGYAFDVMMEYAKKK